MLCNNGLNNVTVKENQIPEEDSILTKPIGLN